MSAEVIHTCVIRASEVILPYGIRANQISILPYVIVLRGLSPILACGAFQTAEAGILHTSPPIIANLKSGGQFLVIVYMHG